MRYQYIYHISFYPPYIPKYGTIGAAYVTIITLIFSGCLANILIPPYYNVFKIQLYSIVFGWKYLFRLNFK